MLNDIPEPLPIIEHIERPGDEPRHLRFLKVNPKKKKVAEEDETVICTHEDGVDTNYTCVMCGTTISHFNDDTAFFNEFIHPLKYIKVKYVSDFDTDLNSSNIVYLAYQPRDINEIRELNLYYIKQSFFASMKQPIGDRLTRYLETQRVLADSSSQGKLVFDSMFESGNLRCAEFVDHSQYNLYMNVDTNTKGHQQWFYFSVKKAVKGKTYQFSILNFTKPKALFRVGMKIAVMSSQRNQIENNGQELWTREGENIRYFRTRSKRSYWKKPTGIGLDDSESDDEDDEIEQTVVNGIPTSAAIVQKEKAEGNRQKLSKKYYYGLSFSYTFKHDEDEVYFAHSYPFTYTDSVKQVLQAENELILQGAESRLLASPMKLPSSDQKDNLKNIAEQYKKQPNTSIEQVPQQPQQLITNFPIQQDLQSLSPKNQRKQRLVQSHEKMRRKDVGQRNTAGFGSKIEQRSTPESTQLIAVGTVYGKQQPVLRNDQLITQENSIGNTPSQIHSKTQQNWRSASTKQHLNQSQDSKGSPSEIPDPIEVIQKPMLQAEEIRKQGPIREKLISHDLEIYYIRENMCYDISGVPVMLITITAPQNVKKYTPMQKRPIVFISSRVHPGESVASFVFQGIFKYLVSKQAAKLRRTFIFKLVPCLNPDGVICGNYRSSLAGEDLNRQWREPDMHLEPCVYSYKKQIRKYSREKDIFMMCDIHGHSRKRNSFIYGCTTAANGSFLSWTKVRLLPRIMARRSEMFNYRNCKFKLENNKLGTARVVGWKEMTITNSFTLENSFYGYKHGDISNTIHYSKDHLRKMGVCLVDSLIELDTISRQIERDTDGWLKPGQLFEYTGVPAAKKLEIEYKKKKEEAERRQSILEYQNKLWGNKHSERNLGVLSKDKIDEEKEERPPSPKMDNADLLGEIGEGLLEHDLTGRINSPIPELRDTAELTPSQSDSSLNDESRGQSPSPSEKYNQRMEQQATQDSKIVEKHLKGAVPIPNEIKETEQQPLDPKDQVKQEVELESKVLASPERTKPQLKVESTPPPNKAEPQQEGKMGEFDWKNYFDASELKDVYNKIKTGEIPENDVSASEGSEGSDEDDELMNLDQNFEERQKVKKDQEGHFVEYVSSRNTASQGPQSKKLSQTKTKLDDLNKTDGDKISPFKKKNTGPQMQQVKLAIVTPQYSNIRPKSKQVDKTYENTQVKPSAYGKNPKHYNHYIKGKPVVTKNTRYIIGMAEMSQICDVVDKERRYARGAIIKGSVHGQNKHTSHNRRANAYMLEQKCLTTSMIGANPPQSLQQVQSGNQKFNKTKHMNKMNQEYKKIIQKSKVRQLKAVQSSEDEFYISPGSNKSKKVGYKQGQKRSHAKTTEKPTNKSAIIYQKQSESYSPIKNNKKLGQKGNSRVQSSQMVSSGIVPESNSFHLETTTSHTKYLGSANKSSGKKYSNRFDHTQKKPSSSNTVSRSMRGQRSKIQSAKKEKKFIKQLTQQTQDIRVREKHDLDGKGYMFKIQDTDIINGKIHPESQHRDQSMRSQGQLQENDYTKNMYRITRSDFQSEFGESRRSIGVKKHLSHTATSSLGGDRRKSYPINPNISNTGQQQYYNSPVKPTEQVQSYAVLKNQSQTKLESASSQRMSQNYTNQQSNSACVSRIKSRAGEPLPDSGIYTNQGQITSGTKLKLFRISQESSSVDRTTALYSDQNIGKTHADHMLQIKDNQPYTIRSSGVNSTDGRVNQQNLYSESSVYQDDITRFYYQQCLGGTAGELKSDTPVVGSSTFESSPIKLPETRKRIILCKKQGGILRKEEDLGPKQRILTHTLDISHIK